MVATGHKSEDGQGRHAELVAAKAGPGTGSTAQARQLGRGFVQNPAVPARPPATDDDTSSLLPAVAHSLIAVVELPFEQLEQATAALRGEPRYQLTERVNVPAGEPVQVMD